MEKTPTTVPVTYAGETCGEITLHREGLYVAITCQCAPVSREILRAYAVCGGRAVCLGVLEPEREGLRLRRRLPASKLDCSQVHGAYLQGPLGADWAPWQGEVDGQTVTGLTRQEAGQQVVAVAYDPASPQPLLRHFASLTPLWLEGRPYLTLRL